jgi:hypothetical protein
VDHWDEVTRVRNYVSHTGLRTGPIGFDMVAVEDHLVDRVISQLTGRRRCLRNHVVLKRA